MEQEVLITTKIDAYGRVITRAILCSCGWVSVFRKSRMMHCQEELDDHNNHCPHRQRSRTDTTDLRQPNYD